MDETAEMATIGAPSRAHAGRSPRREAGPEAARCAPGAPPGRDARGLRPLRARGALGPRGGQPARRPGGDGRLPRAARARLDSTTPHPKARPVVSRLPRWAEEGATAEELRLLEVSRRERPDPEARSAHADRPRHRWSLERLSAVGGRPSVRRGRRACRECRECRRVEFGNVGNVGLTTKVALLIVCGGGAIAGAAWFATARRAPVMAGATTVSARARSHVVAVPPSAPTAPEVEAATNAPAGVGASSEPGRPPHARPKRSFRSVPAPSARAPERRPSRPEPPAEASTLAAEVAALERAQAALAAHDAPGALRALDHYEATFPSGRLASEENVLRVQALLARGDAGRRPRARRALLRRAPRQLVRAPRA